MVLAIMTIFVGLHGCNDEPDDPKDPSIVGTETSTETEKDTETESENNNNQGATSVVTSTKVSQSSTEVTLSGMLNGVKEETEVGFLLSLSKGMNSTECRKVKLTSTGGRFESTIKGILDQEVYYYRAYALVDGKCIYGEILSFETGPYTYKVNGKEFQVIKVKGGPYGDFSILQTELSVNDKLEFAGIDLGITLDCDKIDGNVSSYETKKYFGNLCKMTGFLCRFPTSAEWLFAAEGGQNSKYYKFSGSDNIDDVAWYIDNCFGPRESGLKKANELGIYDMSGNFSELVIDTPLSFINGEEHLPNSSYYDWSKGKAYGGRWDQKASFCTIKSSESLSASERNLVDGKKYSFRFVYSHNIGSYYDLNQ